MKPLKIAAPEQSLRSRLLGRGSIAAVALDQAWIETGRRNAARALLGDKSVALQAGAAFLAGIRGEGIKPADMGKSEITDGSQA